MEANMNSHEPVSDITTSTEASAGFQHFVGGFVLPIPCILCENNIVYVQDEYDLIDFFDKGRINVRTVRFWHAYLKGYHVTLILLDLKSGELLKRSHRLNDNVLPCDWVLVKDDIFDSKSEPEKQ
jgi:hypothetical protein